VISEKVSEKSIPRMTPFLEIITDNATDSFLHQERLCRRVYSPVNTFALGDAVSVGHRFIRLTKMPASPKLLESEYLTKSSIVIEPLLRWNLRAK
jgi:hypothetical protein